MVEKYPDDKSDSIVENLSEDDGDDGDDDEEEDDFEMRESGVLRKREELESIDVESTEDDKRKLFLRVATTNKGFSASTDSAFEEFFWQPPPGDKPIKVDIKCACFDISNISTVTLCAEVKFVIVMFWDDPRFQGSYLTTNDLPGDLWGPDMTLENALVNCTVIYDSFSLVDPLIGRLKRTITFHGSIWNPMDLKEFPFDRDDLELKFTTNSNWRVLDGSRFGNDPVNRVYTLHPINERKFFEMGTAKKMNEFKITNWSHEIYIPKYKGNELEHIVFEFRFHMVRRSTFYYLKIFFPLWLLVLTSGAAFTMHSSEDDFLSGRYEFLTTVLLAIVGFLYIVQETIPKVGFLTIIDKVVILSLISVVTSIFTSWGVSAARNDLQRLFNLLAVFVNQGIYWLCNFVLIYPAHRNSQQKAQEEMKKNEINQHFSHNSSKFLDVDDLKSVLELDGDDY